MTDTNAQWLTQEAHDRLAAELEHLDGEGRAAIAKKVAAAREEGDLRENGGYHAAREQLAQADARIRYLKELLRTAVVGEAPVEAGVVAAGTRVTATILGSEETFLIGSREIAGDSDLTVYSESSPIGSAILGKRAGDSAEYLAPNGRRIPVAILAVEAYAG